MTLTYAQLIATAFARWPERVAFITEERTIGYREQQQATRRLQLALKAAGIGRGDGVAVLSGNTPEAFFVAAAAICLGCRYVPLNPWYSRADQLHVLADAGISALVFEPEAFGTAAGELVANTPGLAQVLSLGPSPDFPDLLTDAQARAAGPLELDAAPEDVAVILYTGGSTGQRKGVALSQRTLAYSVLARLAEWQWPEQLRLLAITGLAQGLIVPAALRGGTAILVDGFDPESLARTIERHRITMTFMVPAMVYALLDHLPESLGLGSLQTVVYGNAPIGPTRLGEAVERFGPIFMQEYSLTEATPACVLRREDHLDPTLLASCGRPLAGIEVALRDEEDTDVGMGATAGTVGELCIRGETVMSGYWGEPELSRQALRGGWLHTGDMAYADDRGFLYLVDRKQDMIVSAGLNVYSREVEDALCGLDGVAAAAVFAVPDELVGEAVHATVVPRPGVQLEVGSLQAELARIKGAHQVPRAIDFVTALPLTAHGKTDKRALRAPHWQHEQRGIR